MNKARRERIQEVADNLNSIVSVVEQIKEEEDEYRDNMPENLQTSEKYEYSEECSDKMDDVITSLNEQIEILQEIGS